MLLPMTTHEMTIIYFTKNVFALFNHFYINTAELNIFVQVKIKVVLFFTISIIWPQIMLIYFLVLAGQSLWLLLRWVLLPRHLHALPPTSISAPSGEATASKCGAGCAVPSAIAVWVTPIACSSLITSSSSSP